MSEKNRLYFILTMITSFVAGYTIAIFQFSAKNSNDSEKIMYCVGQNWGKNIDEFNSCYLKESPDGWEKHRDSIK